MVAPRAIRMVDPLITFTGAGASPTPIEMKCFARGVHLTPESDDAAATFCDPLGFSWLLTIDFIQSLTDEGLDAQLWALGGPGTVIDWEFAYVDDGTTPATEDNPHWSGRARLPAWAPVDAGINEPTEINLEMDVIGDVTRDPAPVAPV